jgi:OmpA-OmpF porin, OOP family
MTMLIMTGFLSAGQQRAASQAGFYLSLTPSATGPFTIHTTSPILSPARIDSQWGGGIDGALGYRYGGFRVEGEVTYGRSNGDRVAFPEGGGELSGHMNMWGATANFLYDIPTGSRWSPYLGAGLGGMRVQAKDLTLAGFPPTHGSSTVFAYKVMSGVSCSLTQQWRLLGGYRFTATGEQDYETGGVPLHGKAIRSHALQAGVQFYF